MDWLDNNSFMANSPSSSSGEGTNITTKLSFCSTGSKPNVDKATTSGADRAILFRYVNKCDTVGNTTFKRFRRLRSPSSPAATGKMASSMNWTSVSECSGRKDNSASRTSTNMRCLPPSIPASIAAPAASAASMTVAGAVPNILCVKSTTAGSVPVLLAEAVRSLVVPVIAAGVFVPSESTLSFVVVVASRTNTAKRWVNCSVVCINSCT